MPRDDYALCREYSTNNSVKKLCAEQYVNGGILYDHKPDVHSPVANANEEWNDVSFTHSLEMRYNLHNVYFFPIW